MTDKQPSMQEILGSIRRIMAKDSDDFAEAAREQRCEDVEEQVRPVALGKSESEPIEPRDFDAVASKQSLDAAGDTDTTERSKAGDIQSSEAGLLSAHVESEVARAFGGLRKNIVVPQGRGISLDDMVREMLQPILRQWLDAHLPGIIERLVREELRRIARDFD